MIASEVNYPFVFKSIFKASDLMIITADSISMITKYASYKSTAVVDLFDALLCKKNKKFIDRAKELECISPFETLDDLVRLFEKTDTKLFDNADCVAIGLERIL